ncbi:MAG: alpha/beta fold hydrolase, partial [Sphingomonadales bacterium]
MSAWQEDAFSSFAGEDAKTLIVIAHGLRGSSEQLASVADAAVSALGAADVYIPTMPYSSLPGVLSAKPPAKIVCELTAAVDALHAARLARLGNGYDRIVLIGYSMGALIARKLAVVAHGEKAEAPFEPGYEAFTAPRAWAERIARVVLLGGISRGWSPSSAAGFVAGFVWRCFSLVATLLPARNGMLMESRFGLPFPVQTRLQWLALTRANRRDLPVVQLLGSRDNVVSPDDMMDVAVDGVAQGSHALLDVPATGHTDVISMGAEPGAIQRRQLLHDALTMDMLKLAAHPSAISSALLSDGKTPEPEDHVTDVVFVVHGIRDKGFWTSKVARAIKREAAACPLADGRSRHVRSMTESYGYLAMLPFLWVGVRRAKTAWLMDRYVEARARYPEAKIHFVCHSNGTYLAVRALH